MKQKPETQTRHRWIREWMLREMQSYPLSARLPSDRELAKRLKVAPLTVKRAMGDLERDGYVARRQGKGTFLVSREKSIRVRSMDSARNGKVLFAYPNYFSYEYWQRAYLAEELALKNELGLLEFKMHPYTTYRNLLEFASTQDDIRGILIDPVPGSVTQKVFRALDDLGVPVVMFASTDFLSLGERIYSFIPDWFKQGYLGARYLLERGHESIGLIENEPLGQDRGTALKGIRHAVKETGLPARSIVRPQASTKAWDSSTEAGYRLMGRMLDKHEVTGVIVASMYGTLGALRRLGERGVRVPEEMSLITNGELGGQEEYASPPPTSVRFDMREQVSTAFDVILGAQTPTSKTFLADVSIVERVSVNSRPSATAARSPRSRKKVANRKRKT